jgi:hypothetical protein
LKMGGAKNYKFKKNWTSLLQIKFMTFIKSKETFSKLFFKFP